MYKKAECLCLQPSEGSIQQKFEKL